MGINDMIGELMGKKVVVAALFDREIGTLTEATEEWIKLTKTNRKGVASTIVIKVEMIMSIAEL